MLTQLVDFTKRGTLIVGYYRTGTHFIHDIIRDRYNSDIQILSCGEMDSLTDLTKMTSDNQYTVAIANDNDIKMDLIQSGECKHWHIIRSTRNDKIGHYISRYFWMKNSSAERLSDTGMFKHHGTPSSCYLSGRGSLVYAKIPAIKVWLQEELINLFFKGAVEIDHSVLSTFKTDNICWTPNEYNLTLEDLFVNSAEVRDLLERFTKVWQTRGM